MRLRPLVLAILPFALAVPSFADESTRYVGDLSHRAGKSCGEDPSVHVELDIVADRVEGWREIKIGRDGGGRGHVPVKAEIVDGRFQQIVEMKAANKGNTTRVRGSINGDVMDVAIEAGQGDCSSYAGTLTRQF